MLIIIFYKNVNNKLIKIKFQTFNICCIKKVIKIKEWTKKYNYHL